MMSPETLAQGDLVEAPIVDDQNWHKILEPDAELNLIVHGVPIITLCGVQIPLGPGRTVFQGSSSDDGKPRRDCPRCTVIWARRKRR